MDSGVGGLHLQAVVACLQRPLDAQHRRRKTENNARFPHEEALI